MHGRKSTAVGNRVQQPGIKPTIIAMAKLELDRFVEFANKCHNLWQWHTPSLQLEEAPAFKSVVGEPGRALDGQEQLVDDIRRCLRVHGSM